MASSGKEGISNDIREQFCTITGATPELAVRLLEACGGNLDMAIGMHMDGAEGAAGGAGPSQPSSSRPGQNSSSSTQPSMDASNDDVRAPIPQRQEVLVQDNRANFGNVGLYNRRRQARSVFDGFRDFEAETRQQELEMASGQPKSAKHKRLEDLFRPPIDLMFKGSFQAARDAGASSNRWLMVNIQNAKEFQCQVLNRDVWSNPSVKPIVKEHFIFWQVYNDSEEGKKYMQFYKVYHWPYIAVLDPRTGENMVSWNNVDAMSFCELATSYLAEHSQPEGPSPVAEPPAKRQKTESITDADEEAQLEAALKASVVETKAKEDAVAVVSSDEELTSDVELETFTDSEDETDSKPKPTTKPPSNQDSNDKKNSVKSDTKKETKTVSFSPNLPSSSSSSEDDSSGAHTSSSGKPRERDTNGATTTSLQPPSTGSKSIPEPGPPSAILSQEKDVNISNGQSPTDSNSLSSSSSKDEKDGKSSKFQFVAQSTPELSDWRQHLGDKEDPETIINIRYPDGKRQQFKVPSSSKLRALILYVQEEGYHKEMYELVTNFPKRRLSYLDFEDTLKNHELFPQETVFVQER